MVHGWRFLLVSAGGGRGEGALWGPFPKGTNPIQEGSTLMTSSPPKSSPPPRPHPVTVGVRIQHRDSGGLRVYTAATHLCLCPRTDDLFWTSASWRWSPIPSLPGHPCAFCSASLQCYLLLFLPAEWVLLTASPTASPPDCCSGWIPNSNDP